MANQTEDNPFLKHQDLLVKLLKEKHHCPTVWQYDPKDIRPDGEAELNAVKQEYWVNEECGGGYCEYCYGHRYNEYFEEKPTMEDVIALLRKKQLKTDRAQLIRDKEYKKELYGYDENNGQLITLCIDKDYKQIPKLYGDIVSQIKQSNYGFLSKAQAVLEIHTEHGIRPHIHLLTEKIKKAGYVSQILRRKFQNDKYQIYRIDVKQLPYEAGADYIRGDKGGEETDVVKTALVQKDREYRMRNKIENLTVL
jgi:hypothetical protein